MTDDAARPTLTLYRRDQCHLCDDAERLVRDELAARARAGHPAIEVRHVDITDDPELEARYWRRIPVLEMGGYERELVTSAGQVRELLALAPADPA
jgi:Glutaredoxin-like domain (DUF836)